MKISIAFLVTALVLASTLGEAMPVRPLRGSSRPSEGAGRSSPGATGAQLQAQGGSSAAADGNRPPPNLAAQGGALRPGPAIVPSQQGSNTAPVSSNAGGSKQRLDNIAAMINGVNWPIALGGQIIAAHVAGQNLHSVNGNQASVDAAASSTSTSSTAPASSATAASASDQYQRRSSAGRGGRSGSSSSAHSPNGGTARPPTHPASGRPSGDIDDPLRSSSTGAVGGLSRPNTAGGSSAAGASHADPRPNPQAQGDGTSSTNPNAQVEPANHQPTTSSATQSQPSSESIPLSSKLGLVNAVGNLLNAGMGVSVMGVNQHAATEKDHAGQQQGAASTNSTASNSTNSQAAPAAATSSAMNWDFGMPVGLVA